MADPATLFRRAAHGNKNYRPPRAVAAMIVDASHRVESQRPVFSGRADGALGCWQKPLIIVAAIVGLVAVLAAMTLRRSFDHGRLAEPPAYDDVAYFLSAVRWLSGAASRSIQASVLALLQEH